MIKIKSISEPKLVTDEKELRYINEILPLELQPYSMCYFNVLRPDDIDLSDEENVFLFDVINYPGDDVLALYIEYLGGTQKENSRGVAPIK